MLAVGTHDMAIIEGNPFSPVIPGQYHVVFFFSFFANADAPFIFPCVYFITLKNQKHRMEIGDVSRGDESHTLRSAIFDGCLGSPNSAAWQQTLLFGGIAWRSLLGKARRPQDSAEHPSVEKLQENVSDPTISNIELIGFSMLNGL